jgi:hypothetical protein
MIEGRIGLAVKKQKEDYPLKGVLLFQNSTLNDCGAIKMPEKNTSIREIKSRVGE